MRLCRLMPSVRIISGLRFSGRRLLADNGSRGNLPVTTVSSQPKTLNELLEPPKTSYVEQQQQQQCEVIDLSGVPVKEIRKRNARVFRPAREASQVALGNTKCWKVELNNCERWENPLMGWSSNGDPLSNITMAMNFACKEDAIRYCERNNLNYEVIEPNERKIGRKAYGDIFSWNKRTRITHK